MVRYAREMPAKLAASAFELFSRQGIQSVTMEQIAAHTGVTKGSLYWHYHSKDEIIQAACGHYYRTYHRRMQTALALVSDPVKRMEKALRFSVRSCLLDRENRVFSLEIFTLSLYDETIRRSWRQFLDSVREIFVGLVSGARLNLPPSSRGTTHLVNLMLDTMEGIKLRALFEPSLCSIQGEKEIIADLLEILLGSAQRKK